MRYIILVLLNLPIILIALINLITSYKLKKISAGRFRHQIFMWFLILIVIIGAFPVFNLLSGRAILDSSELSLFDIAQTTIIIYLIYIVNGHRQKIDQQERRLRNLHQEVSIKLADK